MIDYELAKELADAGFPQLEDGVRMLGYPALELNNTTRETPLPIPQERTVYVPTLSELIDACGNAFDALFSPHQHRKKGQSQYTWWTADATNDNGYSCTGYTPEEAVARLWLAIQKK